MEQYYGVTSVPQYGAVYGFPQYNAVYGFPQFDAVCNIPQYGWLTDGYGNVFHGVSFQPIHEFVGYNGNVSNAPQYAAEYGIPQYGGLTDGYGNVCYGVSIQPIYHDTCGIPSAPIQDFVGYNDNVTSAPPQYAAEYSIPQYTAECSVPQNGRLTDDNVKVVYGLCRPAGKGHDLDDKCRKTLSALTPDFVPNSQSKYVII